MPVGVGLMSRGPTGADGIDHHRRQPLLAHQVHHRPFRQELRALVGADEVRLVGRRGLVGRRAVLRPPQRGDRTAMHDALHARRLRRAHHRQRALDVGPQHRVRIGHPEPIVGRDVEHVAAAGGGARQRGGVGQVAQRQLGIHIRRGFGGRWWAAPAGAGDARAPPAPAPPRTQRSRSRRSAMSGRPLALADPFNAKRLYSPRRLNRCRAARSLSSASRKAQRLEKALDRARPGWSVARHRADRLVRDRPRRQRRTPRRLGGFRGDRRVAARAVRRAGPGLGRDRARSRGPPALGLRLGPHGARRLGQLPAVLAGGRLRVRRAGRDAARRVMVAGDRLHRGRRHRRIPRPACLHRHRARYPAGARPGIVPGRAAWRSGSGLR